MIFFPLLLPACLTEQPATVHQHCGKEGKRATEVKEISLLNILAHSPALPWVLTQELKSSQSCGSGGQVFATSFLAASEASKHWLFVSELCEHAIVGTVC